MLVHVTRLTDVQSKVTGQVKESLSNIRQCLVHGADDPSFSVWQDIKALWEEDYLKTTAAINNERCPAHEWSEVAEVLPSVVQTIKIREINGSAGDVLDYERHRDSGLNVIAIGGDKLSRGLTLEGLLVSYFTRPSKTYDTLMQMGRWFGYRDGFLDLTRLFAPEELINWFRHISDADSELRNDFETMCAVGGTPETFGHRVRTHPLLQVTSPVKMRHGQKEKCSYSGDLVQTIVFHVGDNERFQNISATNSLLNEAGEKRYSQARSTDSRLIWEEVPAKLIITFLESYKAGSENGVRRVDTNLIAKYVNAQTGKGNLINWTVLVSGKPFTDPKKSVNLAGSDIGLVTRTDKDHESDYFRPGVISSPNDERAISLTEQGFQKALEETKKIVELQKGTEEAEKVAHPRGPQLRKYRSSSEGLLIIYPIDPSSHPESEAGSERPFIGFAISFPGIDGSQDIPVEYIVNSVGQQTDG